jgi:hypothetical protein
VFDSAFDQLLFDFNMRPAQYIDKTWLPTNVALAWDPIVNSASARARDDLSRWVLETFDLSDTLDFEFGSSGKRLLLLDPETLSIMIRSLGLMALRGSLKKRISQQQQLQLKAAIGEAEHEFFRQQILAWPATIVYPDAAHLDDQFGLRLMQIGQHLFESSLSKPGDISLRRTQLKLPRSDSLLIKRIQPSELDRKNIVDFCISCTLKNRFPQWHWLF